MAILKNEVLDIRSGDDVVRVRQMVRNWATECGFSLIDQTKIVTAASELARNALQYGGGGTMSLDRMEDGGRKGLRLTFSDQGPGIADIALAMKEGYTTGSGLGLGLSGAKRLCNDFAIRSAPGEGTTVTIARWK